MTKFGACFSRTDVLFGSCLCLPLLQDLRAHCRRAVILSPAPGNDLVRKMNHPEVVFLNFPATSPEHCLPLAARFEIHCFLPRHLALADQTCWNRSHRCTYCNAIPPAICFYYGSSYVVISIVVQAQIHVVLN